MHGLYCLLGSSAMYASRFLCPAQPRTACRAACTRVLLVQQVRQPRGSLCSCCSEGLRLRAGSGCRY